MQTGQTYKCVQGLDGPGQVQGPIILVQTQKTQVRDEEHISRKWYRTSEMPPVGREAQAERGGEP